MEELKPCPFCGNTETEIITAKPFYMLKKYQNRYCIAGCRLCGVTTRLFPLKNNTGSQLMNEAHIEEAKRLAAEAWNRRVTDGRTD